MTKPCHGKWTKNSHFVYWKTHIVYETNSLSVWCQTMIFSQIDAQFFVYFKRKQYGFYTFSQVDAQFFVYFKRKQYSFYILPWLLLFCTIYIIKKCRPQECKIVVTSNKVCFKKSGSWTMKLNNFLFTQDHKLQILFLLYERALYHTFSFGKNFAVFWINSVHKNIQHLLQKCYNSRFQTNQSVI